MGGTLSHRSEGFSSRTFIQPCIQKLFSTFQNYLFHCFYFGFFKGHGEKLFGRVLSIYFMFVFLRDMERNFLEGFSPRTFCEHCIQKLFSTFQIYLFHCFYVCFLKGHGEKLFERVLSKNIL